MCMWKILLTVNKITFASRSPTLFSFYIDDLLEKWKDFLNMSSIKLKCHNNLTEQLVTIEEISKLYVEACWCFTGCC
jgi:hypothetical protein